MTPDATTANTPSATPAPDRASTTAKMRHRAIVKFPLRFHCAISQAMGDSLRRMTGSNSLMAESDIGRIALHSYLLANDPYYARAMQQGHGHG
jgi:hypothetical protein